MFLANSTLNIGQNTSITFVKCQIHPAIYLNYSTLNVEGNVNIAFINNSRSSLMMKFSSLNIMRMINISFIRNSNTSEEGIAVNVEHSTMTTEGNWFFINNLGHRETVCIQTSTFIIRKSAKLQFINNSAISQTGGMHVLYTTVRVEDNASLTFTNNTCVVKNGALALLSSNLYLRNNTSITFTNNSCLLYTSPSPRDATLSRMPSSA